ncbi:protein [Lentinula edodes]|uniref:Protein n=1 Tax=Lentinula edodes TaxID=5353 RepID=A0A1Q3E7F8_LENED|nr:protein [Lentinula edodes]
MLVSTSCSVITLSILSIISITWSYTFLEFIHAFTSRHTPQTVHNYSFQGNDIPEMLQLDFGAFIQLDAEETVHFALNYPSASENEWLKSEPYGRGADITLEQGSFMSKNFTADRWGDQYTCRDWNILYDEMKKNWIEFYRYRVEKGIIKYHYWYKL